jgi:hypothetical protein
MFNNGMQDVLKKIQHLVSEEKRPVRFGVYDAKEVSYCHLSYSRAAFGLALKM